MKRAILAIGILVTSLLAGQSHAVAQVTLDSKFTYQGRILKDGVTVDDTCDFEFSLCADAGGVTQIGMTQTIIGVAVTDGLFTVELNSGNEFGPTAFIGDERFLEIAVKCPPGVSFTPLSPLQPITPAPYALALPGLRTTPSGNPDLPDRINVIGGHRDNIVDAKVSGATISGGVFNSVSADFGTVGGGSGNDASSLFHSTIGGGQSNTASGSRSTIAGGSLNTALGDNSTKKADGDRSN
jgi:hypothetical protein